MSSGNQFCKFLDSSLLLPPAQYALQERGFYQNWAWVWAGLGTVLGLSLILLALQIVALHFLGRELFPAATLPCAQ